MQRQLNYLLEYFIFSFQVVAMSTLKSRKYTHVVSLKKVAEDVLLNKNMSEKAILLWLSPSFILELNNLQGMSADIQL